MVDTRQSTRRRALILHAGDTVAVALETLPAGTPLELDDGGTLVTVTLLEPIDQGHKVALKAVQAGEPVYKYGQKIGIATQPIASGQHVHVHNLVGLRGRGDLAVAGDRPGGRR